MTKNHEGVTRRGAMEKLTLISSAAALAVAFKSFPASAVNTGPGFDQDDPEIWQLWQSWQMAFRHLKAVTDSREAAYVAAERDHGPEEYTARPEGARPYERECHLTAAFVAKRSRAYDRRRIGEIDAAWDEAQQACASIVDRMSETEARTVLGLVAKLCVWRECGRAEDDQGDGLGYSASQDALRLLDAGLNAALAGKGGAA